MKRLAAITAVFLVLAGVAAAGFACIFSSSFLTAELARAIEQSSGKRLGFQSGPRITLWPEFGIAYGNVSLKENGSAGEESFAEADEMRVMISPAALIRRRLLARFQQLVTNAPSHSRNRVIRGQ